jgi:hypothetical protein
MTDLNLENLDRRLIERMLRLGSIDEKAYEKYLRGAADVTENATAMVTVMEDDDDENSSDDVAADVAVAPTALAQG